MFMRGERRSKTANLDACYFWLSRASARSHHRRRQPSFRAAHSVSAPTLHPKSRRRIAELELQPRPFWKGLQSGGRIGDSLPLHA